MSKKGGGDAPSPDPKIGEAAVLSAQTGKDWLAFATKAFDTSTKRQEGVDALSKRVTEQQLGISDFTLGNAKEDRARYEAKGIPAQDAYVKELGQVGSAERQQSAAAEARSGVQTEAAIARDQAQRESAAMGVRPDSGRAQGIARAGELATAAAASGAANTARTNERGKALAAKGEIANVYAGLPAQSQGGISQTLNAGNSATGIAMNNQQLSNSNSSIMNQGFGGMLQGVGQQANTLLNQYGIQMQGWAQEQANKSANMSAGLGALGTIGGALVGLSSRKAKTKLKKVKDGDGIKAVKGMPVSTYKYKPGYADGGAKSHTGTMSDHFAKATGRPDTGHIDVMDAIGVTMKAVQDLDKKIDKVGKASGIKPTKPPAARRSSQSPAKARGTPKASGKATIFKAPVKAKKVSALGIGR